MAGSMLPRSHFASPDEAKDYLDQLQDNLGWQRQDRTPEECQANSGPQAQPAVQVEPDQSTDAVV